MTPLRAKLWWFKSLYLASLAVSNKTYGRQIRDIEIEAVVERLQGQTLSRKWHWCRPDTTKPCD